MVHVNSSMLDVMFLYTQDETCNICPITCVPGFCCEVNGKCVLLGYYTASSGSFLPTFPIFSGHVFERKLRPHSSLYKLHIGTADFVLNF